MYIEREYLKLLKDILSNGVEKDDRTGTGTLSVFGRQIRHSMSNGFPLLTTKKMSFKTIVTELLWFLQGRTDLRYLLENNCHIWTGDAYKIYDKDFDAEHPPFSAPYPLRLTVKEFEEKIMTDDEFNKMYGDLGPIYGKQWRSCKKYKWDKIDFEFRIEYVDQIENLINDIKADPDSRRLMVSAWNVAEIDHMTLPPCHYGFQVYTRELTWEEQVQWVMKNTDVEWENLYIVEEISKDTTPKRTISLMWNQRSVDTFLGLPFNIASYGLLLEIIAKATNMIPDELVGNLGDTHLYLNHIDQAKEQLTREPMPLSKLNINTEFWPYEGGECGEGLLDAVAVFKGFEDDNFCKCLLESDIQLSDYQSHPAIKAPLSN
jgi:thymidylate synthase